MENMIRSAFVSQKNAPNKRLADIISRVETQYGMASAELDEDLLGLVSAAGEPQYPSAKKEDRDG